MNLTVRQKGDTVSTFRFISVYLMETLARWVPSTPELEVKVCFGRHLWEFAQHADALGKRTGELRLGMHHSRRPTDAFVQMLETFAGAESTAERVDGFYHAVLPVLEARYRAYVDETDPVMDEPTVRIVERILADLARIRAECGELSAQRPDVVLPDATWPDRLVAMADAASPFVDFRPPQQTAEIA